MATNNDWDSLDNDDLGFEDISGDFKIDVTPMNSDKERETKESYNGSYDEEFYDEKSFDENEYDAYDDLGYEEGFDDYEQYEEDYPDRNRAGKEQKDKKKGVITTLIVVLAAVAFIALIVLLASLIFNSCSDKGDVGSNTTVAWEENKNQAINDLINKYFDSRVLADTNTLASLVDSKIVISEEAVKNESAMTEAYRDIKCYVTDGMKSGEYAVYVTYAVKFKNIDTPAPGLIPFYVRTDNSGNLKLIPWQYIKNNEDFADIQSFIDKVSQCDQITKLSDSIEEQYQNALASDPKLKEYILSIGGDVGETTAASTEPVEEGGQQGDGDWSTCDEYWYASSDNVNVRKEPSTDSTVLQTLPAGTKVHVVGKKGEWFKLQLRDGSTAYINQVAVTQTQP